MAVSAVLLALVCAALADTLLQVQMLYRHGDRSQIVPIPGLPQYPWPNGFGQLTETGMVQEFNVGRYLNERYVGNMLHANYTRSEIYVRSTDTDRTIQSALSELAGLYIPADNIFTANTTDGNISIAWQPIPVHSVPIMQDQLLRTDACGRYNQLYADLPNEQIWIDKLAAPAPAAVCQNVNLTAACTNAQLLTRVGSLVGVPSLTLLNFWEVADALFCLNAHDVLLPSWVEPSASVVANATFTYLQALYAWEMFAEFYGPERRMLSGGFFLQNLIQVCKAKIASPSQNPNFYMYSAHDTTIASVLETLNPNYWNALAPPYASALFFELYLDSNNSPFVQVRYKNHSELTEWVYPGQILLVPGCASTNCSLSQFESSLAGLMPGDWATACANQTVSSTSSSAAKERIAIPVVLVSAILIGIFIYWYQKRRAAGHVNDMRGVKFLRSKHKTHQTITDDSDDEQM
eukprot:m.330534 g.330534  ORF g.330534 m.330534 type:complete len:463 (-) comp55610_c0_seq4:234-1622(-)